MSIREFSCPNREFACACRDPNGGRLYRLKLNPTSSPDRRRSTLAAERLLPSVRIEPSPWTLEFSIRKSQEDASRLYWGRTHLPDSRRRMSWMDVTAVKKNLDP